MLSAVTISLVPEARGGPFVFWDDLAAGCAKAAELGFDAVEIFPTTLDQPGTWSVSAITMVTVSQTYCSSMIAE